MRLLAGLLISVWIGKSYALGVVSNSIQSNRIIGAETALAIPEAYRPFLTFSAPLRSSTVVYGRGSQVPTYTRNSVASYLSPSTGLIAYVVANEPRFEANGYFSEGARTNALKDSAGFVNGWTATNATIPGTVSITSPDGTGATYFVMADDTTDGVHSFKQSYTKTTKTAQSISVHAKKGGITFLTLEIGDGGEGYVRRTFNLTTGAVATGAVGGSASDFSESASSITASPNGFYRCVMTTRTIVGTAGVVQIYTAQSDNVISYAGNSASVFIWGAQVEDNAVFASSYIPTTTAAVARAADALTYGVAGNISTSQGTVKLTGFQSPGASGLQRFVTGTANVYYLYFQNTNLVAFDGTNAVTYAPTSTTTPQTIASTWGGQGLNLYHDNIFRKKASAYVGTMAATTLTFGNAAFVEQKWASIYSTELSGWDMALIK